MSSGIAFLLVIPLPWQPWQPRTPILCRRHLHHHTITHSVNMHCLHACMLHYVPWPFSTLSLINHNYNFNHIFYLLTNFYHITSLLVPIDNNLKGWQNLVLLVHDNHLRLAVSVRPHQLAVVGGGDAVLRPLVRPPHHHPAQQQGLPIHLG